MQCALCSRPPEDGDTIHWNPERTAWVHHLCLFVEEVEQRSGPSSPWRQGVEEVHGSQT